MKSLLLFSTRVERWGTFQRPSEGDKKRSNRQMWLPVAGAASAAARSFQEWPAITDIQRRTSGTRPRTCQTDRDGAGRTRNSCSTCW